MRTIKFRAFDDGKMIYENDILHIRNEDNLVLRLARFWSNIRNDSQIMQFTGLRDKNGKEIYEGDILKTSDDSICYVVFEDIGFAVKTHGSESIDWEFSSFYSECEIIGNIHKNPELLN